jgi:hypothetical protein
VRLAPRLLLFAPLAAFVAATNYFVDPGNLFGSEEREAALARTLATGRSVAAGFAFDEPRLQKFLAEGRSHAPDVLVLGSSRTMMLSRPAFGGHEVVNASISSASLEDMIALFELYEEHGLRPRIVLVGIDPWALNGSLRNPSVSLEAELHAGLRRLGRFFDSDYGSVPAGVGRSGRWLRLASPAYFQASFSLLITGFQLGARGEAEATAKAPSSAAPDAGAAILPDGSREWSSVAEGRSRDAVVAMAAAEGARSPAYLQAAPVSERILLLQAFLDFAARLGVRTLVWLPPYAPAAYSRLVTEGRGRGISQGEEAVRSLATARGLTVLGSYDPAPSGVSDADFIDSHHMRRDAGNLCVARLLREAGVDLDIRR